MVTVTTCHIDAREVATYVYKDEKGNFGFGTRLVHNLEGLASLAGH
ncbi:MAG TPA: hypothetical protein VGF24_18485 [Vicinamibacterales bacterium]